MIQGASGPDVAELRASTLFAPAGEPHRLKSVLPVFATSGHPPQADSARDKSGNDLARGQGHAKDRWALGESVL
jgi:hypothetical protein